MGFKYDVLTLIELVESRPCLWNKCIEDYKDKIMKQNAWTEVFQLLEEDYYELQYNEQKEIGQKITTKWVNIKDSFLKSLKTKSGQVKKNYIYGKYLQFLIKPCPKKEYITDSLSNQESIDHFDSHFVDVKDVNTFSNTSQDLSTNNDEDNILPHEPKRYKKVATSTGTLDSMQILEQLKNTITAIPQTSFHMSDDEKFFLSFIPYLKDMTESEKIELQMDILNSVRKIKQNRSRNQPNVS